MRTGGHTGNGRLATRGTGMVFLPCPLPCPGAAVIPFRSRLEADGGMVVRADGGWPRVSPIPRSARTRAAEWETGAGQ